MISQKKDKPVSVIMPVYNGVEFMRQSLPPLMTMLQKHEVLEVIVVDDSSTDNSAAFASKVGARVIPSGGRLGPGAARNMAAKVAEGEILWFVDADVVVHADSARKLCEGFSDESVVAVFGSYDDQPPAQNFLSQYKNLVHHYYHSKAGTEASTFWSGCGGILREVFLNNNGFDMELFKHPSIEDIELGYRLIDDGGKIYLAPELKCTHLKEWRLWNLLHTEVIRRALPWSRLMLARGSIDNALNVSTSERMRAVIAILFFGSILCFLAGLISWYVALLLVVMVLISNWTLFRLFYNRRGLLFSVAALLFHQLYYLYSSGAFVWAFFEQSLHRIRSVIAAS